MCSYILQVSIFFWPFPKLVPGEWCMTTIHTATDVVDTVINRHELLDCLLNRPLDKRTLEDDVSVSRSTIDRAVRELEVLGLVEYSNEGYKVTPVGELVTTECADVLELAAIALEFDEFLRWLPLSRFDLDIRLLADAELLVPESNNPYSMINRHVHLVEKTNHGRAMLPLVGLHAFEAAHENIVENGAETELVVESGVAEVLLTNPPFEELTSEMLQTGRFEVFVYDGTIPYFVGVYDDKIIQIGADEDSEPRALVETDRDEVRTWAHATIDAYKQQATELSQAPSQKPLTPAAGE